MPEKSYVLGIDIGGTSVKIGAVYKNEIIESTSIRNTFKGDSATLVPGLTMFINYYVEKYKISKLGIGCPGEIVNGVVTFASNLGYRNYDIYHDFKNAFPNLKIVVDNDGNAACNAELKYGKLKEYPNGIFVTIGKGIGGTIIEDGKIKAGVHGLGGRIGHMVIHTGGRYCNCGKRGCFESYASVTGFINTVKEVNYKWKNEDEKIATSKMSGYQIVQLCKENNPIALAATEKWNYDLAEGLLNLCCVIDPQIIVIAGGITESDLLNIELIKDYFNKQGYANTELCLATFKGKTGLIGAAALAENE